MTARHYFSLQDIKISFEDVDFYAKLSLILNTLAKKHKNPADHSNHLHASLFEKSKLTITRRKYHSKLSTNFTPIKLNILLNKN